MLCRISTEHFHQHYEKQVFNVHGEKRMLTWWIFHGTGAPPEHDRQILYRWGAVIVSFRHVVLDFQTAAVYVMVCGIEFLFHPPLCLYFYAGGWIHGLEFKGCSIVISSSLVPLPQIAQGDQANQPNIVWMSMHIEGDPPALKRFCTRNAGVNWCSTQLPENRRQYDRRFRHHRTSIIMKIPVGPLLHLTPLPEDPFIMCI